MDSKGDVSQSCTSRSSLPPFSSLTTSRSRAAVTQPYDPHQQRYTSSYHCQPSAPLACNATTVNPEHQQLTSYHHQVFFDGQGPYYNQHFPDGLVQPPVTDMSLGLPYSSNQPIYLTSTQHSVDMFSPASSLPSSTDHPPQIPLSQIESFLSAAEQKPMPEFIHAQPQHWENSYRSSSTNHSTPLGNFSPFCSKSSETLTDALDIITSIGETKTNGCIESEFYSPKNSGGFNMMAEFSSFIGSNNTSSSGFHLDSTNYNFTTDSGKNLLKSSNSKAFAQNGLEDCGGNHNIPGYTNMQPSSRENDQCMSNSVSKCKKKKKSTSQVDNVNISGNLKIIKKRTKKCKLSNTPDLSNPERVESASPGPCLSPTFIASLSSKRADEFSPSDCPAPFSASQHGSDGPSLISNKMPVKCNNQTPQVPNGVNGNFQQGHFKKRSQNKNLPSSSKLARVNLGEKYSNTLTVDVPEENKSPSPYQFSPEFLASLSSKRAEVTMDSTSLCSVKFQNYSAPLQSVKGVDDNIIQGAAEKSLSINCPDSCDKSPSPNPISPGFLASLSSKRVKPSIKKQFSTQKQNMRDIYLPNNQMEGRALQKDTLGMKVCSPKPYRSPPVYNSGSGFQYPTPPMEEEDVKGPSPTPGFSPPLLPSSCHGATNLLGQCLSPTLDDALPTPPNSAGPKPTDTMSKEEQTSRILEIIAREREKVANAPPVPLQESKKKKKKKRLKEVGESNSPGLSNNSEPCGGDMNFQFYPKFSLMANNSCLSSPNNGHARNFPQIIPGSDKLGFESVPNYDSSRQDFSNSKKSLDYLAVTVNQDIKNQLPFGDNQMNPFESQNHIMNIQQQHYNNQHQYIQQQAGNGQQVVNRFQIQTTTSQVHETNNMNHTNYNQQQGIHNQQADIHNQQQDIHNQHHFNHSQDQNNWQNNQPLSDQKQQPFIKTPQVNNNRSGALHGHCDTNNTSIPILPKSDHSSFSMDQLLSKRPPFGTTNQSSGPIIVKDPYAFDEPEQEIATKPLRKNKSGPASRHPVHPSSQVLNTEMQRDVVNSLKMEKPLSGLSITNQNFLTSFSSNHLQCNSLQPSKTVATEMCVKMEPQNFYRNCGQTNVPQNQVFSTLSNGGENQSSNNLAHHSSLKSEKLTYDPSLSFVKQEVSDVTQSRGIDQNLMSSEPSQYYKQNIKKCEIKTESDKKKRGRPPKFMDSETSPDIKPKAMKHKLQDKKTISSPSSKLQYRINGVSAKQDDLKLDQSLVDRLANNLMEVADCSCLSPDYIPSESLEGPYYTQLGAARDIPAVRKVMEHRTGVSGAALRIEKVIFTGKEGKSKEGCPVAKWIIRRSGPEEKYLCIVRKRPGHFCETAVIIVVIVAWEGVMAQQADSLYDFLITTLPKSGLETDRRCGLNEKKTCACQGVDLLRRGASFSFGCSWSMYYNGCKFARSQTARKFKLKDIALEDVLSEKLEQLATDVSPLYSRLAPDAFRNQTQFESQAGECRLGCKPGRPFSGVTAVVDFCCHSHRDCHNMNNGSTVVVNLTKHRGFEKPDDEQYHVLPLYILDQTDESGSMEGQMEKVRKGSLEILSRYMTQVRMRSTPYRPCQRNRTTPKKQGLKKGAKKPRLVKAMSFPPVNYDGGESPGSEYYNDGFQIVPPGNSSAQDNPITPGVGIEDRNQESMSYTDLMARQGMPGFNDLYTKFWDYFYTHGVFPPRKWTSENKDPTSLRVVKNVKFSPQERLSTVIQPSSADQMFLHQQQQQLNQRRARQQQQQDDLITSNRQHPQHRQQVSSHPDQGQQRPSSPPPSPRQQSQISQSGCLSSQAYLAEPHKLPCLSQPSQHTSPHPSVSHVQHSACRNQHPTSSSQLVGSHPQADSANSVPPQYTCYTSSIGSHKTSSLGSQHNLSLGSQNTSFGEKHLTNHSPPQTCNSQLFFNYESPGVSQVNNSPPAEGTNFIGQVGLAHPTRPPPPYSQAVGQSQDMQIKSQVASSQCPPPSYKDSVAFGLSNHPTFGRAHFGPASGPGHPHSQSLQSSPRADGHSVGHLVQNWNHNVNVSGHQDQGYKSKERKIIAFCPSQEGSSVPSGARPNSLPCPDSSQSTVSPLESHSGTVDVYSKSIPDSLMQEMDSMTMPNSDNVKSPNYLNAAEARCWSRMSEPLHETDNNRPFSRMSEPDLAHGCPKKHISNPTLQVFSLKDNDSSKHSFTQNLADDISRTVASNPGGLEKCAFREPMEQPTNLPLATFRRLADLGAQHHKDPDRKEAFTQNKIIHSLMGQKEPLSKPTLIGPSTQLTSPVMSSFSDHESVFSPSQANIYPNGPMPGEKVKIHKSEGFVVPTSGQGPREPPYQVIDSTIVSVETDDNKEVFEDPAMGGVAIALCHGAVLFEVAKRELHATTALKEPNRYQPKRISLVFYQHKNLNLARHGFEEYERKTEERRSLAEQARLIDEMETNGFLKGELSELASFPNLTKGTFGKVFNFPEAKETLFPLRFPRYLDCSPLEQITPVMFACMSIAFPKYIKEAFPNPSSLPRLMNGRMPIKMASSLSDRRTNVNIPDAQPEDKKVKLMMETLAECVDPQRSLPCTWNPNIPLGHMITSNSIITRWVHDETSVTGPYNKWLELAVPSDHRDDMEEASEADLKEKMFESLSQLDEQVFSNLHFQQTNLSGAEPNFFSSSSVVSCKPKGELETKTNPSNDTPMSDQWVSTLMSPTRHRSTCSEMPDKAGLQVREGGHSIIDHRAPDPCHTYQSGESGVKSQRTQNGQETITEDIPGGSEIAFPETDESHCHVKFMASQGRLTPEASSIDRITTHESPRNPVKHSVSLDLTSGSGEQLAISDLRSPASPQVKDETNNQTDSSQQQCLNFESRERQSMYDFLIHGFNRPFLSKGLFASQEVQNISTNVTKKERTECDSTDSEMK